MEKIIKFMSTYSFKDKVVIVTGGAFSLSMPHPIKMMLSSYLYYFLCKGRGINPIRETNHI